MNIDGSLGGKADQMQDLGTLVGDSIHYYKTKLNNTPVNSSIHAWFNYFANFYRAFERNDTTEQRVLARCIKQGLEEAIEPVLGQFFDESSKQSLQVSTYKFLRGCAIIISVSSMTLGSFVNPQYIYAPFIGLGTALALGAAAIHIKERLYATRQSFIDKFRPLLADTDLLAHVLIEYKQEIVEHLPSTIPSRH